MRVGDHLHGFPPKLENLWCSIFNHNYLKSGGPSKHSKILYEAWGRASQIFFQNSRIFVVRLSKQTSQNLMRVRDDLHEFFSKIWEFLVSIFDRNNSKKGDHSKHLKILCGLGTIRTDFPPQFAIFLCSISNRNNSKKGDHSKHFNILWGLGTTFADLPPKYEKVQRSTFQASISKSYKGWQWPSRIFL